MKCLLISHGAGGYGAERVLRHLAGGLADRGHEVVLEFPHDGPAAALASGPGSLQVAVGRRARLPRRALELPRFLAAAPRDIGAVRRLVRDHQPAVTVVNSLYNPWTALGARLAGRPVVWYVHEASLPEPVGTAVAALLGLAADRIPVVSGFVAGGYRRYPWLRRRLSVVPNPLLGDWAPATPPADSEPFTVGYVGQLEPRKRTVDLIRAIARLPDARAILVGDGKGRSEVESAIRQSGTDGRVRLVGFQADVRPWLGQVHCIAIPSVREPFGLVGLEAMAAGVPVVAARSGGLPEVLGEAALYHRPGDPADLAEKLRRLRDEPGLRRRLIRAGLDRVGLFAHDQWIRAMEAVLEEAAAEGERR